MVGNSKSTNINVLPPKNLKYNMNTYTRIHEHAQTHTEGRGDEPQI